MRALVCALFLLASTASAQSDLRDSIRVLELEEKTIQRRIDSLLIERMLLDKLDSLRTALLRKPSPGWPYLAALPPLGYAVGVLDRDAGGYRDSFRTGDKVTHVATCAAIYAALRSVGAPRWAALVGPLLSGVALEAGQSREGGYFSARDLVANGVGCGAAWTFDVLLNKENR